MRRAARRLARSNSAAIITLCAPAPLALGAVPGQQLPPPGPTGCGDGLTVSDEPPPAELPPTMRYRSPIRSVNMRLRHATQVTRGEISAFLPDGPRVDTRQPGEYSCTLPGASQYLAFEVDERVQHAVRRRGRVKLRIRLLMVNATGRASTLRRTVTVRRQGPAPRAGAIPVRFTYGPVLVATDRGAVLHVTTDRAARSVSVQVAGRRTQVRAAGGTASGVYQAFTTDRRLRAGRRYPVAVRAVSRSGATTTCATTLFLHRRWPRGAATTGC